MFLNGSSPKSNPADNLDEVKVAVKRVYVPPEDLPEITVSARPIPWYAWMLGGVASYALVDWLRKR